jgi:two-component system response regulator MprA
MSAQKAPVVPADRIILIADDSPDMREMLAELLELMFPGVTILLAEDGLDAVSVAMDVMPWIVVLDLDMPRLDGVEAAKRLRTAMGRNAPLLIAVSGDHARLRRAYDSFDYSLRKPFNIERLAHYLARAMTLPQRAAGGAPCA